MEAPSETEPQSEALSNQKGKPKKHRRPLISPSSSFVDFAQLDREIYTSQDKVDDYDPYSQRKLRKPITDFEAAVHLLKGCVGAGLLSMSKAFHNGGAGLGTIGTILLALLCGYGIHVMLRMKYLQCKWLKVPFLALPRALKIALLNGPPPFRRMAFLGPFIADFFLVANQIGLCATYLTFISTSFKKVMEPHVFDKMDIRFYLLILVFPTLLVNYIRNLKRLSIVSLIGNILMAASIGLCLYYIFSVGPWALNTPGQIRMVASYETWPLFVSITIFAIDAVGVMITLEHNMKTPAHFLGYFGLFPWSMVVIVSVYVIVGLCSYLKYGEATGPTIVSALPKGEWMSTSCQVMIALAIFGSYPIQLYVGLEIIWGNYLTHYVKNRDMESYIEYVMRTSVVLLTFVLAFTIPQIDLVISLVGSFCLSILSLVIPFLLELCTCYPDYGCCKHVLIKDALFILIGFIILIIGTGVSIKAIVEFNPNEKS